MIINGKLISQKITSDLKEYFLNLKSAIKIVIIQVGNDLASNLFISLKEKKARELNVEVIHEKLESDVSEIQIINLINKYNNDDTVQGIMIQSPIPDHNFKKLCSQISLAKDIDGLNYQLGSITKPAVVESILKSLEECLGDLTALESKKILIINDSIILGRPLMQILLDYKSTVMIANKFTLDLKELVNIADIIITATGIDNLIKNDWNVLGKIIIDCGSPNSEVQADNYPKLLAYTPVPGGIGPLTVVSLYSNLKKLIENYR